MSGWQMQRSCLLLRLSQTSPQTLRVSASVGWVPINCEAPVSLALVSKRRTQHPEAQTPKPKLKTKIPSSTIYFALISEADQSLEVYTGLYPKPRNSKPELPKQGCDSRLKMLKNLGTSAVVKPCMEFQVRVPLLHFRFWARGAGFFRVHVWDFVCFPP